MTLQEVGALCAVALLTGAVAGYHLAKGDGPEPEVITTVPEVRQEDGSLILARDPEAKPAARHHIPAGAVREREISVTVQPTQEDCPPVRVDLTMIRDAVGRRVEASSPDGRVVGGVDIPIEAGLMPPPVRPWAAGVTYEPFSDRYGIWIERDISRFRIGADLKQGRDERPEAWARLGWRWG